MLQHLGALRLEEATFDTQFDAAMKVWHDLRKGGQNQQYSVSLAIILDIWCLMFLTDLMTMQNEQFKYWLLNSSSRYGSN